MLYETTQSHKSITNYYDDIPDTAEDSLLQEF